MFISVKDAVLRRIKNELGDDPKYNFSDRIQVWADTDAFKWKEDESVWAQHREKIDHHFTIYLDGIFISDFEESDIIEAVMLKFWRGLKEQITQKNLDLDPVISAQLRIDKEQKIIDEAKAQQENIDKIDDSTEVRKLAKEVVKRVSKTATRPNT